MGHKAGRRVALLIAASMYEESTLGQLRSPAQDVKGLGEVLDDPAIGGFDEIRTLIDQPRHEVEAAVEDCFADRGPDDLVLLYISSHGIKDSRGRLYFAMTTTRGDRLASTAMSSVFVNEQVERSRAAAKVVLLDCCYSGAFAAGLAPKAPVPIVGEMAGQVSGGHGCYVLAASDALEYSYEGGTVHRLPGAPPEPGSVFTDALLAGLRTGEADGDGDGWISADDLSHYVTHRLAAAGIPQRPTSFSSRVQGMIRIARGRPGVRHGPDQRPGIDEVRTQLVRFEERYATIREVVGSGQDRTNLLDQLVFQAAALGQDAQRLGLLTARLAAFERAADAERLVTLALLQGQIDASTPPRIGEVVRCMVAAIDSPRTPFEQFHALIAATMMRVQIRDSAPERRQMLSVVRAVTQKSNPDLQGTSRLTAANQLIADLEADRPESWEDAK